MTNSEINIIPSERRTLEHTGACTSNAPTDRDDQHRWKSVTRTAHSNFPQDQDPKLLHHLDGYLIIRDSHTPFASGGFCDVFTGQHPKYGKVAMRRPRMTEKGYELSEMTDFLAESEIWKELRHPNILQFIGLIQSDGYIWAVSRFAENGSLTVYLQKHPETDRRALVFQLADAIAYLHRQRVVHGDIKGSNILISATDTVLLCDFGLSKLSGTTTRPSSSGLASIRWCAPEVLIEEAPKTFASDVYSFGMTVYEILSGNMPFHAIANDGFVITEINRGVRPVRGPAASACGDLDELWALASESWDGNPSNRLTMDVICKRLGVPLTLPIDETAVEASDVVDGISAISVGGEQMRRGIDQLDERITNVLQVAQAGSSQTSGISGQPWNGSRMYGSSHPRHCEIADEEIIQKIPRAKAQYNSSLRRGARRCLQETRTGLLQTIQEWIDGTGPHNEPIFWLSGEAGTGKSTIAHTIAQDRDESHQLGASFFFSRNEEARRDANLFISTLAYQLSLFNKGFKVHLAKALKRDPTLPEKTVKIQLKEMVMEPLKKTRSLSSKTIVIVVDALDECSPDAAAEEILEAWAELIQDFPLRLFITSRPSWHIQAKFSASQDTSTAFHLHDISKTIVKADVEHFFRVSLTDVLNGGLTDDDLEHLSQQVGLLFILASTYVKYIKDPIRRNPSGQFRALLSRKPTLGRSPEGELNALYLEIVNGVPEDPTAQEVVDAFRMVVGAMIVSGIPMTPNQLSNFLRMDKGDILYVLRRLSSVIFLADDSAPASFFHQSFSEFLTDPKRCTNSLYAIDKSDAHKRMAVLCLDIFDTHLQDNVPVFHIPRPSTRLSRYPAIHGAPTVAVLESEIPEALSLTTSKPYPAHLCYACVYFGYHLNAMRRDGYESTSALLARFELFYEEKIHRWLEVIASIHDIPGVGNLEVRLHNGFIKYYQNTSSHRIMQSLLLMQKALEQQRADRERERAREYWEKERERLREEGRAM